MDRRTITTLAHAMGGRLLDRDTDTGWYLFPSESELLAFREQIPFLNLWGNGSGFDGEVLIVYFDESEALPA